VKSIILSFYEKHFSEAFDGVRGEIWWSAGSNYPYFIIHLSSYYWSLTNIYPPALILWKWDRIKLLLLKR